MHSKKFIENMLLRSVLLVLLFACTIGAQEIPPNLLEKANVFVGRNPELFNQRDNVQEKLKAGDIYSLYQAAKVMNQKDDHRLASIEIFHALADYEESPHILSQVALGFTYSEQDIPRAIKYFVDAGEKGPHQASLYNAGRLLAQEGDFPKALAYIRACANLHESAAEYAKPNLTETCTQAYHTLSSQIKKNASISLQATADMFLYASLEDFPPPNSQAEKYWKTGMQELQHDNYMAANRHLSKLSEESGLSDLQIHLLKALKVHMEMNSKDEL